MEARGVVTKFGANALVMGFECTVDRGVLGSDVAVSTGVEAGGVWISGCADGGVDEDLGACGALNLSTLRKIFCKSNAGFPVFVPEGGAGCCPKLRRSGFRNGL